MFRALKTKKDTPKYGLIYHSALVGQASTKNKGKISRSLAAKASLATRVDAFGEEANFDLGTEHRAKLETRLRILEDGNLKKLSGTGKAKAKFEKYQTKSEIKLYPTEEDSTLPIVMSKKRKLSDGKPLIEEIKTENIDGETSTSTLSPQKKKIKIESDVAMEQEDSAIKGKKKKNKKQNQEVSTEIETQELGPSETLEVPKLEKKKKKKKSKPEPADEEQDDS